MLAIGANVPKSGQVRLESLARETAGRLNISAEYSLGATLGGKAGGWFITGREPNSEAVSIQVSNRFLNKAMAQFRDAYATWMRMKGLL